MITIPVRVTQMKIDAFNSEQDKQYELLFMNYDVFPNIRMTMWTDKKPNFKIGQKYEVIIREGE